MPYKPGSQNARARTTSGAYRIAHTGEEDKGYGLYATRDIRQGEHICYERALFTLDVDKENIDCLGCTLREELADLELDELNAFRSLTAGKRKTGSKRNDIDIFWNNAMSIPSPTTASFHDRKVDISECLEDRRLSSAYKLQDYTTMLGEASRFGRKGIFTLLARINHSCQPNVSWAFREDLARGHGAMILQAITHIKQGEELCCSYFLFQAWPDTAKRRLETFSGYDFDCQCVICAPTEEQDGSSVNSRWERLEVLADLCLFDECEESLKIRDALGYEGWGQVMNEFLILVTEEMNGGSWGEEDRGKMSKFVDQRQEHAFAVAANHHIEQRNWDDALVCLSWKYNISKTLYGEDAPGLKPIIEKYTEVERKLLY